MSEDYYDILGINKGADSESVRNAYRAASGVGMAVVYSSSRVRRAGFRFSLRSRRFGAARTHRASHAEPLPPGTVVSESQSPSRLSLQNISHIEEQVPPHSLPQLLQIDVAVLVPLGED